MGELPDWASALDVLPFATTALYDSTHDHLYYTSLDFVAINLPVHPVCLY